MKRGPHILLLLLCLPALLFNHLLLVQLLHLPPRTVLLRLKPPLLKLLLQLLVALLLLLQEVTLMQALRKVPRLVGGLRVVLLQRRF